MSPQPPARALPPAGFVALRISLLAGWVARTSNALALLSLRSLAVLLLLGGAASALEVPPLEGRVNDRAGVLSARERGELEARLAAYERGTGHQLAVLIVPSNRLADWL